MPFSPELWSYLSAHGRGEWWRPYAVGGPGGPQQEWLEHMVRSTMPRPTIGGGGAASRARHQSYIDQLARYMIFGPQGQQGGMSGGMYSRPGPNAGGMGTGAMSAYNLWGI